MKISKEEVLLHLSLIDGIGPATIWYLAKQAEKWEWTDFYTISVHTWMHEFGLKKKLAENLVRGLRDTNQLEKELAYVNNCNVQLLTIFDEQYPLLLSHIHVPPPILYCQGTLLRKNEKCIAVIGSRNAQYYAECVIKKIIPDLIKKDWSIVSGGALGADSMAHRAALENRGRTIVVLGSGLLHLYPQQNTRLFEKITACGGTLLSSFSMDTKPRPANFPMRNRIIAGLSHGCVIVRAAEKSGARITAQYALDQGREVFAVPGSVDDERSVGCHQLIKEGATLVHCSDDILEVFNLLKSPKQSKAGKTSFTIKKTVKKGETKKSGTKEGPADNVQALLLTLCETPHSIDELIEKTKLDNSKLQEKIIDLQFSGKIQQDFTGRWVVV